MDNVNVSDVLADANAIYSEVTETTDQHDNISDALDVIEDMSETTGGLVMEGMGLDRTQANLMRKTLVNVIGLDLLAAHHVGENQEVGKTTTKLVTESLKQVVKDFWQALKSSFNVVWAKLKNWYITISSAAESLSKKAKATKTKAERLVGATAKEKRFDFKKASEICMNRKVSPSLLKGGMESLKDLTEQTLNVRTASEVEKFINAAQDSLDDFVKNTKTKATPDDSWVSRFNDIYTPSVAVKVTALTDPNIKKRIVADEDNFEYKITGVLPGDLVVVYSELKDTSTLDMAEKVGGIGATVVRAHDKDIESTQSVETLQPFQVADFCDQIVDFCDVVTFYEKAWQRRDKFMNGVLGNLDKAINNIENEDLEEGMDKAFKRTARAITSAVKRSNSFNAGVINTIVKVSANVLLYCSASLAQYS